jgi:hypothetical protein
MMGIGDGVIFVKYINLRMVPIVPNVISVLLDTIIIVYGWVSNGPNEISLLHDTCTCGFSSVLHPPPHHATFGQTGHSSDFLMLWNDFDTQGPVLARAITDNSFDSTWHGCIMPPLLFFGSYPLDRS